MIAHSTELMMAIVVASTALVGFQAVVISQIVQSRMRLRTRRTCIYALVMSFVVALVAISSAILWFMNGRSNLLDAAAGSFMAQLTIAGFATYVFWLLEMQRIR